MTTEKKSPAKRATKKKIVATDLQSLNVASREAYAKRKASKK